MTTATPAPEGFEAFTARHIDTQGSRLFVRTLGDAQRPAVLLVHGFPQTHVLWRRVALALADRYFLVMPDLRGYGDSSLAPGGGDHVAHSKRALAQDLADVMSILGIERFFVCGHDRGGRVAHRLALDHAARVRKLCVLDIAPTLDMYARTDMAFARAYYHWFHLIQPAPLPERMIEGCWREYLHAKLGGWGTGGLAHIEPAALAEYKRCFARPEAIHTACEDYRASAGIDLEHDRDSRARGHRVACDMLVLWGANGVVHRLFDPLSLWQAQCTGMVSGQAVPTGHFIPEERPAETAQALAAFFGG